MHSLSSDLLSRKRSCALPTRQIFSKLGTIWSASPRRPLQAEGRELSYEMLSKTDSVIVRERALNKRSLQTIRSQSLWCRSPCSCTSLERITARVTIERSNSYFHADKKATLSARTDSMARKNTYFRLSFACCGIGSKIRLTFLVLRRR